MARKNSLKIEEVHHLPNVFEDPEKLQGSWYRDYFNNGHPLVLELGCGRGEYTIALGQKYPDKNFIGIDIKGLEQDIQTGRLRLKTKFINQHFINELDKIGLLLIGITGTFTGKLVVNLEPKA